MKHCQRHNGPKSDFVKAPSKTSLRVVCANFSLAASIFVLIHTIFAYLVLIPCCNFLCHVKGPKWLCKYLYISHVFQGSRHPEAVKLTTSIEPQGKTMLIVKSNKNFISQN